MKPEDWHTQLQDPDLWPQSSRRELSLPFQNHLWKCWTINITNGMQSRIIYHIQERLWLDYKRDSTLTAMAWLKKGSGKASRREDILVFR